MTNIAQEAKKRFLPNIITNIAEVIFTALISLWLTRYFIQHLGVAAYAMIPLTSTIVRYFNLFLVILTGSIGRFVALYIGKGDYENSNKYFNSAFWGLLLVSGLLALPAILFTYYFSFIFQVPHGLEIDSSIMVLCVIFSSLITALTSPFTVSTFVTHRFTLANIVKILSRFLQLAVILALFTYFSSSLSFIGISYVSMSSFILILYILFSRYLTPQLKLNKRQFNWNAFREMVGMGTWTMIDEIGALLYLSTDLIIINLLMGMEQQGRYAVLLQIVLMLRLLAPALSSIFAPIAIDMIAKHKYDVLVDQTTRAMKYIGLFCALLAGGICGFASPLLHVWLGESFQELSPLLILLIFPQILFLPINPLYNINRGLNKVKFPAIATLVGGLINILMAIVIIKYTSLGLYGVGLATVVCYSTRTVLVTPLYTATILKKRFIDFLKPVLPGLFWGILITAACFYLNRLFSISSFFHLVLAGMVITLCFMPFIYFKAFNDADRRFFRSLVKNYGIMK